MAKPSLRQFQFIFDPKVQSMDETQQRRLLLVMTLDSRGDLDRLDEGELACALRIPLEELAQSKALFLKKELIDESWHIRLASSKQPRRTPTSTERVRRHRRKHETSAHETHDETQCNVSCNAHETLNAEPPVCCSSSVFTDNNKKENTTTTQQTTPAASEIEAKKAPETPVVIFQGAKVPVSNLELTTEEIGKIIEWEIQQRRAKNVLKDAGGLRRHLVTKFEEGNLDVTDYFLAIGKVSSYVPPQPVKGESKCTECACCEGNLCSVDYESERVMKPTQVSGCERFAPREKAAPMDPEEVSKLITGLFGNEPVTQHPGPVQRRMKDNVSFDLRTDFDRKQREAERGVPGTGQMGVTVGF